MDGQGRCHGMWWAKIIGNPEMWVSDLLELVSALFSWVCIFLITFENKF
jgi:hypothetical protein